MPIQLDPVRGQVGLLRLSQAAYTEASFLDERLLAAPDADIRVAGPDLVRAAHSLPFGSDFIFHIGHVGSTLVARLLGRCERLFALREPAPLRTLAADAPAADVWLDPLLRLYARTWRPEQRSLVKATSFVSDIAIRILSTDPSSLAVLMLVRPPIYLAGILGGEGTRAELPRLTPARLERLSRRLGTPELPPARTAGEMAAAAWATEACALAACAQAFPDKILWLDFDRFLMDPRERLAACLTHLLGDASGDDLADMLSSPDMYRYSKAPEHAFSAGQRGQILRQASQTHATEITRGLAWLDRLASAYSAVADALAAADCATAA